MSTNQGTGKVVTLGEMLMRLSTPGFERFTQAAKFQVHYGGSEVNVAMSLTGFGLRAAHITRFPENDLARRAVQILRQFDIDTSAVVFGDGRMGLYFLESGAMLRSSRIIYDRFDSAFSRIRPDMIDWDAVFDGASWFHWTGITPAISEGAAATCLEALVQAKRRNITVSGDINYRRNLWQYGKTPLDVMPDLIRLTDKIVAGVSDVANCLDIHADYLEEAFTKVKSKFPNVSCIATTTRQSISASHNTISAMLCSSDGCFKSRKFDLVPIVDRVGAGDAFMAGLIYGWISGKDDQDTINFATAASAWKHSVEGDINIASAAEIEMLDKGLNVGQLLR